MRHQGRISQWQDGQGLGYITPAAGGERVLVDIRAFGARSRRPRVGDCVTYRRARAAGGCWQACDAAWVAYGQGKRRGRGWLLLPALAVVGLACFSGRVAPWLLLWYGGSSVLTFVAYWLDKRAARDGRARIRERTLHLYALCGGWPGALLAQQLLRHKTVKAGFRWRFWLSVASNTLLVIWLATPFARALLPRG